MFRFRNLMLLGICALAMFQSSCNKKFSNDNPLEPVYPPSVFIGNDNGVLSALDYTTGKQNWSYTFSNAIFASPYVYGGCVYVGTINYLAPLGTCDTIFKINSATGKLVKSFVLTAPCSFKATPIADSASLYVATMNNNLYSLDTGTGAANWSFVGDAPFVSSPLIYKDTLIIASTNGTIYSINKRNGTLNWSHTVVSASGSPVVFNSSPALCDSYIYIGSYSDSSVYCIRTSPIPYSGTPTATDAIKWSYKTKGNIFSSPAAGNGKVIVGSTDNNVYCLDIVSGLKEWSFETNAAIFSSPTVYNSRVYIGSTDYNLYALNILNGSLVWKQPTNGMVKSSPLVYNGNVYIASFDNYIYSFNASSGTMNWHSNISGQAQCSPSIEDYSKTQHNSQISGTIHF